MSTEPASVSNSTFAGQENDRSADASAATTTALALNQLFDAMIVMHPNSPSNMFIHCAKVGYVELAQWIFQQRLVKMEVYLRAFVVAARENRIAFAKWIVTVCGPIESATMTDALIEASKNGHHDMIRWIVSDNGPAPASQPPSNDDAPAASPSAIIASNPPTIPSADRNTTHSLPIICTATPSAPLLPPDSAKQEVYGLFADHAINFAAKGPEPRF